MASFDTSKIDALIAQLKTNIFARLMGRAQRQTLSEWRDRRESPGLAARFTDAGNKFYGFSERFGESDYRKHYLPDFVNTGRLRDALMLRQPRTDQGGATGGDVRTVLKFGGLTFNLLAQIHAPKSITYVPTLKFANISAYSYQRNGVNISVAGYDQQRHGSTMVVVHAEKSYTDEFGDISKDKPWIKERLAWVFRMMVGTLVMKGGRLQSRFLDASNEP